MREKKKISGKKLLGIVLLCIAILIFAALTALDIFIGGTDKLLDTYIGAINKGSYESFTGCYTSADKAPSEAEFDAFPAVLGDDTELSCKVDSITANGEGSGGYIFDAAVTVKSYNPEAVNSGEEHFVSVSLVFSGGKWKIDSISDMSFAVTEAPSNR